MNSLLFVVIGLVAIAGGVVVFAVFARRGDGQQWRLAATMLLALGVLAVVTGWVLTGENPSKADALRTGGLAAASVVGLYALWLNDRRRRVEENRHEIERGLYVLQSDRAELDRERADDERFARAVEMLGHDADQVRVGALHALAGLARSRPDYTQTVLDVMCAYLRRPFDHPEYRTIRGEVGTDKDPEADRERQVRFAAQTVITDLLPLVGAENAQPYDLDLHGATLEYFNIQDRLVGQLRIREARLYKSNSFHHCEFRRGVWFTNGRSYGRLHLNDVVFHDRSWFSRFAAQDKIDFERTRFLGAVKFAGSAWQGPVSFKDASFVENVDFTRAHFANDLDLRVNGGLTGLTIAMTVSVRHDHHLPAGWHVDTSRDELTGLVRA
jgi:hypothetical protein